MKRILIFSTAYFPFVGGAEVAIKEITNRLGGRYTFDLVTARLGSSLPKVEQIGDITVYRIGIGVPLIDKLLLPVWGTLKVLKLHRAHRYDLFWAVMVSFASGIPYIVNILRARNPIPIVLTLQEGDPETHLRRGWGGLLHFSWVLALRRTQFLTAISTYLLIRAHRLGYHGPAEVIPNAVSIAHFARSFSEQELHIVTQHIGKQKNEIYLITTGRLVEKNGVDTVIRALTLLPEYVHFSVLGVGPLRAKLEALAREKQVAKRVHFLGFVGHDDMPKYLTASDIFIRPSRSEGMGISFVEAMAAGLPVIATQEGGISDFLFDEKRNPDKPATGWAVDKDKPEQIARAVEDILAHSDKARIVTKNARQMVRKKYNWDIIARSMDERVFARVLPAN